MSKTAILKEMGHKFEQLTKETETDYGVARCQVCQNDALIENDEVFEYQYEGNLVCDLSCQELVVEGIVNEYRNRIL